MPTQSIKSTEHNKISRPYHAHNPYSKRDPIDRESRIILRAIFFIGLIIPITLSAIVQQPFSELFLKSIVITTAIATWFYLYTASEKAFIQSFGKNQVQIAPSLTKTDHDHFQEQYHKYSEKHAMTINYTKVITHDNARLHTCEIRPKTTSSEKYLIIFNDEYGCMATTDMDIILKAISNNITVILFDYRGVGHSTADQHKPITLQDLCTDGIAQVQRLRDQQVNSRNILLVATANSVSTGTSLLGKFITNMVALHFYKSFCSGQYQTLIETTQYTTHDFFETNLAVLRLLEKATDEQLLQFAKRNPGIELLRLLGSQKNKWKDENIQLMRYSCLSTSQTESTLDAQYPVPQYVQSRWNQDMKVEQRSLLNTRSSMPISASDQDCATQKPVFKK